MKIFITGGTGFIGGHVARRLVEAGHQLHGLVRETSDTSSLQEMGAHLVTGTVNDLAALQGGMRDCDVLIHLANVYSFWEPDMRILPRVNVAGTRTVMQAAVAADVKRVIDVSTVAVYGVPAEQPFNEETPHALSLTTLYARTKRQAEEIVRQTAAEHGMELVVLQPGAVIGAGDTRATGQYLEALLDGRLPLMSFSETQMNFIHVADVCDAVVRCLTADDVVGETYLLGGTQMTMWAYLGLISEMGGVRMPYVKLPVIVPTVLGWFLTPLAHLIKRPPIWGLSNDQVRMLRDGFCFDGSKAERELGICYRPVRDAVADAVAWMREWE
ncbi:MAG: NAD-dependent epimerase/dehydratase family protein [Anaerolineaceae bacterium]|nr:NAD-dependent epimerase/dehydratase family protein [Anaerolineaceae bacterium]